MKPCLSCQLPHRCSHLPGSPISSRRMSARGVAAFAALAAALLAVWLMLCWRGEEHVDAAALVGTCTASRGSKLAWRLAAGSACCVRMLDCRCDAWGVAYWRLLLAEVVDPNALSWLAVAGNLCWLDVAGCLSIMSTSLCAVAGRDVLWARCKCSHPPVRPLTC